MMLQRQMDKCYAKQFQLHVQELFWKPLVQLHSLEK